LGSLLGIQPVCFRIDDADCSPAMCEGLLFSLPSNFPYPIHTMKTTLVDKWIKVPDTFTEVQKVHNQIELELRTAGIKPYTYADRSQDLGVFTFVSKNGHTRERIFVSWKGGRGLEVEVVLAERGSRPEMEYYSNKEAIFELLKEYTKPSKE
jgi:hypothetical protein